MSPRAPTILALDPGTDQTAWVHFDGARVLAHGMLPNPGMLMSLRRWQLPAGELAVEMIASYGMPVGASVFETCVWIGRFVEAWASGGQAWRIVYRRDVKLELCGDSRAKDKNIRQALLDRIGPQGRKGSPGPTYGLHGDEWAALGVAVTAGILARREAMTPAARR